MRLSLVRCSAVAIATLISLSPVAGHAAQKTVTLSVENATCALCGPIVRSVLSRVPGVVSVDLVENYEMSPPVTATVKFDDALTDVDSLISATTNAGFVSRLAFGTGG
jgi:mercuric ion binding protein